MDSITETKEYHECERCQITTATEYRLCPCNRKNCFSKKMGIITITKTIVIINEPDGKPKTDIGDVDQIMASMNL